MRVLFLVEAGGKYGMGHLMRSAVLRDELRARGVETVLAVRRGEGPLPDWASDPEGLHIDSAAAAEALAAERRPDWAVVDGYGLLADGLVRRLRTRGERVLAFDDLGSEGGGADLVLNQNVCSEPMPTMPRRLLGPGYALVDRGYAACRERPISGAIQRVLVTFGGADQHGLTRRVVAAFADVPGSLLLDVVVGPNHRVRAFTAPGSHRLIAHEQPHGLAHLFANADLVISAAGSTCWQVCCAGVPLIAVQTVDNQREVVRCLEANGCALTLARRPFEALLESGGLPGLIDRLRDGSVRTRMSQAQRSLVDGEGAARVVAAMGF
jgi:UDP-2,4-diacetamido-2,4,6-trideoxy-beta-L-altropyranose hydrolase